MNNTAELKDLQQQLTLLQQQLRQQGQSVVIVLEGMDAAGKGGLIRRLAWCLDPRGFRVWPTSAPDERERQQHWLQRFWQHMPARGDWALFDRSWYGRVLVERVEQLVPPKVWQQSYRQINDFEQTLAEDGGKIIKIWLEITPQTQLLRFRERYNNPLKQWKLTDEDLRNRARWDDYQQAKTDMLQQTSTAQAPWHVLDANDKQQARLAAFQLLLKELTGLAQTGLLQTESHPDSHFSAAIERFFADDKRQ